MYPTRPNYARSPQGYYGNENYIQRGRSSYGLPPGFQPSVAGDHLREMVDDGMGASPYLVQPSHGLSYPAGPASVIQPLDGGLVDPMLAPPGATPHPSPAARGRSMHRSMSPHARRSLSRSSHLAPSRSRSRMSRVYDDGYAGGGVGYYYDEIGNDRVGMAPYSDYLTRSGYSMRDGGRSYCRIPGETPVIFQDDYGNEMRRVGGHRRYRTSHSKRRPIVIENEYGEPLAYMDDDRYSDYDDDDYYERDYRRRDRYYDDEEYYDRRDRRGRSRSRIGQFFGVRSRSRYDREGPVVHVDSASGRLLRAPSRAFKLMSRLFTGVDDRPYGRYSNNVMVMDDDGSVRRSYVNREGVHEV